MIKDNVYRHAQGPAHSKAPEMLAAAVVVATIFSFNNLRLILTGSGSTEEVPWLFPIVHCWAHGKESIKFFWIENKTELNPFVPSTSIIRIYHSFWYELIKVILWKSKSNWPVLTFYCFFPKLYPHVGVVGRWRVRQIHPLGWTTTHAYWWVELGDFSNFLCGWS